MPTLIQTPEIDAVRNRFIRSFEELRYRGHAKTRSEFCKNTGLFFTSNLLRMEREKKLPSVHNILLLNEKYGVSVEWILLGRGEFFDTDNKNKK